MQFHSLTDSRPFVCVFNPISRTQMLLQVVAKSLPFTNIAVPVDVVLFPPFFEWTKVLFLSGFWIENVMWC